MPLRFPYFHPVRINRIKVKVRVLRTDTTVRDTDFRETKENRIYDPPVEVIGQIVGMEQTFKLGRSQTGDTLPSMAHFVFRPRELDLVSPGFVLKKGDRIVEVNGVTTDFNVIKAVKGSPFSGNRQKHFAEMILLHVDVEQQRKKLGSI